MTGIAELVADNLYLWTSAVVRKSGAGRGSSKKVRLYGIDRLRTLILDLAVRGKLVPQEERDEPSGMLLKQIAEGRLQLIKAGFIRGSKAASIRANVTEPFAIPTSWVWVRLDQLGAIVGGGTPPANDQTNFAPPGQGIPWLTPADLSGYEDRYVARGQRDLTEKGAATSSAKVMPAGTVLFTSRAPIGYVAIAANPIATNQGFKSVVPAIDGLSEFIALTLTAFAEDIDANAPGTTFKEVSGKIVEAIPFPLPPLAEQQRIVAKVDELMALCDTLETQSALALEAHQKLVDTLLATLINSADAADLAFNWARLEAHFNTLFITEASIDTLKRTILDLAVRGKLVAQHPTDEPAEDLVATLSKDFSEIHSEKPKGRRSGRSPQKERVSFELPSGWCETTLTKIGETFIGLTYSPKDVSDTGTPVLRSSNIQNGEIDLTDLVRVRSEVKEKLLVDDGDLLICVRNGSRALVGKCALISNLGEPTTFGAFMAIFKSPLNRYVKLYVESPTFRGRLLGVETTTINQITQANLKSTPIPLPPLAEQCRIVAKVDELFVVCNTLKARLIDASEIQKQLADAIVERVAV